jgi:C4-type Zn-finger protein
MREQVLRSHSGSVVIGELEIDQESGLKAVPSDPYDGSRQA